MQEESHPSRRALPLGAWQLLSRLLGMPFQNDKNSKPGQRRSQVIAEDDVGAVGMQTLFFQMFPEQTGRLGPERTDPVSLSLPMQQHTGRRDQVEIAGLEIDNFTDARSGVEQ